VFFQGLVKVHGLENWGIEACEEHVGYDEDFWVCFFFEFGYGFFADVFDFFAMVLLNRFLVVVLDFFLVLKRIVGHDDF
jgi:hypothetical protein